LYSFAVDFHGAGFDLAGGVADGFGEADFGQHLVDADAGFDPDAIGQRYGLQAGRHFLAADYGVEDFGRAGGIGGAMEVGDDVLAERDLGFHGVQGFPQARDFRQAGVGQQFVVAPHKVVRDLHDLAEHDLGRLGNADVVVERLRHFVDAIEAFQDGDGG